MPRKIKNKQRSAPTPTRRKERSDAPHASKSDQLSERICNALREAGLPLTFEALSRQMQSAGSAAARRLSQTLEQMVQAGEIVQNRRNEYCLRERLPLIVGVVSAHRDGHGLVLPEDRSAPIFLPHRQMLEVIHGDRVAVRISGKDHKGRAEG